MTEPIVAAQRQQALEAICGPACWTPVLCPVHQSRMQPRGRSAGLYAYPCCYNHQDPIANPRHLWDEHDSTRIYTDPVGWQQHLDICIACRGEDDD